VIITEDACRPCKAMLRKGGPVDDFKARHRGRKGPQGETIEVQVINKDLYPADAARYRVDGYPTIVILKDGQEVARQTGAVVNAKQLDALAGLPTGPHKYAEPTVWQQPVLTNVTPTNTYQELWEHLTRDHGFHPSQLRGKSHEYLQWLHNRAHGVR
jgi:thiol-disulfide isomerase/thioredoxin